MKNRIIATVMIIVALCSCLVCHAEEIVPTASDLISTCSCTLTAKGTRLQASATVSAKSVSDKIGFSLVCIQENRNGTWVTVASRTNQYNYNRANQTVTLSYSGKIGYKYRAQCRAYVKDGSISDTASRTSSTKTLS